MMAHRAINNRTEIRQSDNNRLGRVTVRVGAASRSIVCGSGTGTAGTHRGTLHYTKVWGIGSAPSERGGSPATTNLNPRQHHGQYGRPPLLDKSRGFATPKRSRKISALVHTHAVSSARAMPDRAIRAANLSESRIRFPDSPATRRSPQLPEDSTCSK